MKEVCPSVDFHLLKDITFNLSFLNYISKIAHCCDFEICGFFTAEKLYFVENIAKLKRDSFVMHPSKYQYHWDDIQCFFHSHLYSGPDLSALDEQSFEEYEQYHIIYSVKQKKFLLYYPSSRKSVYFSI